MKAFLTSVVLCCLASAGEQTHHWFAKVPVNQAAEHARKPVKYPKGYNQKVKGSKGKKSKSPASAILTTITSN